MKSHAQITLPARLEYLDKLMETVSACTIKEGLTGKRLSEIQLAVEEALVNVFTHAYAGEEGVVEVVCRVDDGNLIIEIIDSGIPFNPLTREEPDVTASVDERSIGGLGILLIRKLMDEVRYSRMDGKNVLDLVARLDRAP